MIKKLQRLLWLHEQIGMAIARIKVKDLLKFRKEANGLLKEIEAVLKMENQNLRKRVDTLVAKYGQICHPEPEITCVFKPEKKKRKRRKTRSLINQSPS